MTIQSARWRPVGLATLLLALAGGCAPGRTVLVSEDSPVRIGPGTTGRVYRLIGGEWGLADDEVVLPEGWYVVPPSFVRPEDTAEPARRPPPQ